MGSGTSADNARKTVASMLANKPDDASDITVSVLVRVVVQRIDSFLFYRILRLPKPKFAISAESLENSRTNCEVSASFITVY